MWTHVIMEHAPAQTVRPGRLDPEALDALLAQDDHVVVCRLRLRGRHLRQTGTLRPARRTEARER